MRFWIPEWREANPKEFVEYWAVYYADPREPLYLRNIARPLTAKAVRDLFLWKNGGKLSAMKAASVEQNFVSRLGELRRLPDNLTGEDFLRRWPKGGAIWRIFFLHCWSPRRFPIYDQHVHRAAACICGWGDREIPASDRQRTISYFDR